MKVKPTQPLKAFFDIVLTELPKVKDAKLVQSTKASSPIEANELGRTMDFNFLHLLKAASPIFANELFIDMDSKLLQSAKARYPISSTELPRIIDFMFPQFRKAVYWISTTESGMMRDVKPQLAKAADSMVFKVFGKSIEFNLWHSAKAWCSISSTELPRVTEARLLHHRNMKLECYFSIHH